MKLADALKDQSVVTEGKKPNKKGKPHDGKHDDGTKMQHDTNGPFKGQKFSQFLNANMVMPTPDNGDVAGAMESAEIMVADGDVIEEKSRTFKKDGVGADKSMRDPESRAGSKVINDVLMTHRAATHRDKKKDYKRSANKHSIRSHMNEGSKDYTYVAFEEVTDGDKTSTKKYTGTVVAINRTQAREKVLNSHRKAYKVKVSESTVQLTGKLTKIINESSAKPAKSLADR